MRSVKEWVGRNDDSPIPPRVRLRVWRSWDGRCGVCGRQIEVGERWDIDHRIPLALGGEHREANLCLVHRRCHFVKTRTEQARKAKADRVGKKHVGIRKRRSFRAWRRFDGSIVRLGNEE